ncbi:MAG: hypothetical protein PUF65_03950 [Lachnospiraceae bacterium]|nr:hypothetical protein [Lachnospiraceae bacterium]
MIDEERVKEMYHMAVYDAYQEKNCHQMGEYYLGDYIGKELIKSFFSGTIAYVLLVVLWGIGDMEALVSYLNNTELTDLIVHFAALYIAFMAVYLLVTVLVYGVRYVYGRKKMRVYVNHLIKVRKLYRREAGRKS